MEATSALAPKGPIPGYLLKLLAQRTAAMPSLDLRFELADLAIEFLEVVHLNDRASPAAPTRPGDGDLFELVSDAPNVVGS
jgi:hypothetical protein